MALTMDAETVKLIAESAGRGAAEQIRNQVREDAVRFEDAMLARITSEFATRFGSMDPSQHVIQHDRLDRFIKFADKVSDRLWGKVIFGIVIVGLITTLAGEFLLKKLVGLF